MSIKTFRHSCLALAVGAMTYSVALAEDSSKKNQQNNGGEAKATQQWIEQLSKNVDLDSNQKKQIEQKLNQTSQQFRTAWQNFNEAHAKAIALEATMYAAIEDGMDEQQKREFRENRDNQKQQAQRGRADQQRTALSRLNDSESERSAQRSETTANNDSSQSDSKKTRAKQSNEAGQSDQDAKTAKNAGKAKGKSQDSVNRQSSQEDATQVYVTRMIIVPVRELVEAVAMDAQQRQQCDQACQKFQDQLTDAWRDVHRYHNELVRIEAEKLRAVESVLNEGQLQKLKNDRSGKSSS